jgi:hypothetical protein
MQFILGDSFHSASEPMEQPCGGLEISTYEDFQSPSCSPVLTLTVSQNALGLWAAGSACLRSIVCHTPQTRKRRVSATCRGG